MTDDEKPLTRGDFKGLMVDHEKNDQVRQEEQLAKYMSAFPGGDPVKHCEYHQHKIDAAKAEQRFWELAQGKVVEKGIEGIFGALKIVVMLALAGLAMKLGLSIPFIGGK